MESQATTAYLNPERGTRASTTGDADADRATGVTGTGMLSMGTLASSSSAEQFNPNPRYSDATTAGGAEGIGNYQAASSRSTGNYTGTGTGTETGAALPNDTDPRASASTSATAAASRTGSTRVEAPPPLDSANTNNSVLAHAGSSAAASSLAAVPQPQQQPQQGQEAVPPVPGRVASAMSGVSTEASYAIPSLIPNLPPSNPSLNLFPQPAPAVGAGAGAGGASSLSAQVQPAAPPPQPHGLGLGLDLNEANLAQQVQVRHVGAPAVLDAGSDAGTAVFSDQ